MIGRTPEYLNKKIEGKEMKLVAIVLIIHPLLILGFSALAVMTGAGQEGITNPGFHGLSQVLYEYASSAANNGFWVLRDLQIILIFGTLRRDLRCFSEDILR